MNTVSAEELLATYPNVPQAVAWTERFICVPPEGEDESAWDLMMRAEIPPTEVRDWVKMTLAEEIFEGGPLGGRLTEALAQTDHPEFLTYLRGKMGGM